MPKTYNLLEICMSPDLGGLELYMLRCAKALNGEFNVISVINAEGKLHQYYDENIDKFYKLKKRSNLFMFRSARALAKIIDENSIDVIHMHWTKDLPMAVMAKMLSKRRPRLVQTRNMTMTRFKDDFYHRYLYKHMDMILPVTYQVGEQIKKFIPAEIRPRVEVLYMGTDRVETDFNPEGFRASQMNVDKNAFVIGLIGRIEPSKGQYLLIDAMIELSKKNIHAKTFFVGHPMKESYQEELQLKIDVANMQDEISFYGFTKTPMQFMQACDVVVLATERETFGLVLPEAMHVQTAVIGANQGGVLEIIDDMQTGLLFETLNAHSLADAIERLYEDRTLLDTVSKEGQKKAQKMFANPQQLDKLSILLKDVV